MPMNPETLKAMKERQRRRRAGALVITESDLQDCADDVDALIAEVERQAGEIAELRQHVADLNHDLEATIKHCNDYHEQQSC